MKTLSLTYIVLAALLSGTSGCQNRPSAKTAPLQARQDLLHYDSPIAKLVNLSRLDKDAISLRIEKSRYLLTVLLHNKPLKAYPVVLGGNPRDDKRQEGDQCTPEGKFRVRALYPHRSWTKFLWLDYPTSDSWRKFRAAKQRGELSVKATIGGQIGIHGVPAGYEAAIDNQTNWTLGCISLKTADIEEIYRLAKVGTRVEIVH